MKQCNPSHGSCLLPDGHKGSHDAWSPVRLKTSQSAREELLDRVRKAATKDSGFPLKTEWLLELLEDFETIRWALSQHAVRAYLRDKEQQR